MRQIKQKQTDFRKNDETIVVYCSLFLVHLPEGEHLCHAGVFDYSGISSEMLIYFSNSFKGVSYVARGVNGRKMGEL